MGKETFLAQLTAELERRAQAAKKAEETEADTQVPDPWDEVDESLSMKGGIGNPRAGYGQMGDICTVI